MLFAPRQGGTSINGSQKEDTGRKATTFYFRKTGFFHSRSGTYCALLLGYFGLNFLPDIRHCVCWVLAVVWAPDSSQKIGNKFLFLTARAEMKVRLCAKLFDSFRGWILIRLTWNLSQIQWRFLGGISGKNHSGKIFRNFVKTKAILYRNLWNSGLISAISFWVRTALKKIHTSTSVCCLHPGKEEHP